MILRRTYIIILFRVLLIILNSLLLSWFLVDDYGLDLIILAVIGLFFQGYLLVRFLNKTNRKLTFFFQSIQNEETNFRLPIDSNQKIEKGLYESLNQISQKVEIIKRKAREQELQFQAVVEQSISGLMAFDNQGFIIIANSAVCQLLQSEVLTNIRQLNKVNKSLYNLVSNIKNGETKIIGLSNGKEPKILSIKASNLQLTDNTLTLLSIVDIKPELDARETDSWIKLTRVLTHEIMNGIAPITSISKTVLGYYEKEGQVIESDKIDGHLIVNTIKGLKVIREQGIGLSSFVEHFRKFSKIPQPVQQKVDVNSYMGRIKLANHEIAEKVNAQLIIELPPDEISIWVDENLFAQALTILISNAADAVKDVNNGVITVKVHPHENGKTAIDIIDNGIGIPSDIIDEIFTPFFTTKPNGTGIGLSIARQIIQMHGGRLVVDSEPNKGSTFMIIL